MNAGRQSSDVCGRKRGSPGTPGKSPLPSAPAAGALTTAVPLGSRRTRILLSGTVPMADTAAAHVDQHDRVSLTVRIDRAMHARLRALAARQRRTHQDIVEGALDAYLNVFASGCACIGAKPKA